MLIAIVIVWVLVFLVQYLGYLLFGKLVSKTHSLAIAAVISGIVALIFYMKGWL
jgi:hypothetical protein